VCGYPDLTKPAHSEKGFGSLEICPSCGFQFNVTDVREGWSFADWRAKWVSNGMSWFSDTLRAPHHWNPKNQLGRLLPKSAR
jgi:hypothetical protein